VDLGRPGGLRQSGGGRSAAAMTRWWSSSGADRARCPKNLNRNDLTFSETGKQQQIELAAVKTPRFEVRHSGHSAVRR